MDTNSKRQESLNKQVLKDMSPKLRDMGRIIRYALHGSHMFQKFKMHNRILKFYRFESVQSSHFLVCFLI